jgi:hypothetical protein
VTALAASNALLHLLLALASVIVVGRFLSRIFRSIGQDRLVPFSCKGRGFCPSCGGRRVAERAAHLVDHVLPDVPIRQAGAPAARTMRGGVEGC